MCPIITLPLDVIRTLSLPAVLILAYAEPPEAFKVSPVDPVASIFPSVFDNFTSLANVDIPEKIELPPTVRE